MTDAGLVRQVEAPRDGADPRRKYYRITESGRELLTREASRLQRVVETARARNVLPETA